MNNIRVISAKALSESAKSKIETSFRRKHSDEIEFVYETDSELIGGVLIVDGDKYYDATVRGQLAHTKREIKV